MEAFQEKLEKAKILGIEIRRLEQAKTQVEREIQIMEESLKRIEAMLSQL